MSSGEAASHFPEARKFGFALAKLGFDVMGRSTEGAFVQLYAVKNAKKPDAKSCCPSVGQRRDLPRKRRSSTSYVRGEIRHGDQTWPR